ncbi:MAG: 4Fe-4S dicluster domain-containing protein [Desulfobacter sp.]|nr:MAG: 4Fe-4S dicluster domain-containing protein [Desulfobacter sp.]
MGETRAAWISLDLAAAALIFWCLVIPSTTLFFNSLAIGTLLAAVAVSLVSFFPGTPLRKTPTALYDERDTMFARNNIQHYPDLMEAYYTLRPENYSKDKQIHNKPEFGDRSQRFHDDYAAPCYGAAFDYLEKTIPLSQGEPAPEKKQVNPDAFNHALKEMILFYGGCDMGVIRLCPYHFYTHKGRHEKNWGEKTDQRFTTAIVIVVPMRVEMIKQAPTSTVIQESAQKYVEADKISNIMAGYLRQFGYGARAHNDANYETLCVPLAVITTDLDLPVTRPGKNMHMANFCLICKKCADNCPSGSITHGPEPESRGFRHWTIDQERCFSYWKTIGSDCGMCISVCPYTKPNTLIHKLVRFYISRNGINQRLALLMDDLLYGRKKIIPKTNPKKIFRC